MTDAPFKDFDAADREVEDRPVGFRVAGEDFSANLNTNAGEMLRWMRSGSRIESIPAMLVALLGEPEYERMEAALIKEGTTYVVLEEVILWLAEQMGSSGN